MSDAPAIYEALSAVMDAVQGVAKTDRNQHSNYNFRGIDAVMNAVGPALRTERVIVTPDVRAVSYAEVTTSGGKPATACRVEVVYTFHAVDGSSIPVSVAGEAWDSGDKACPKAMSVAFRTALLQALCLPTDEPDPDSETFERGQAAQQASRSESPARAQPSGGNGGGPSCSRCGGSLAGSSVAKVDGQMVHKGECPSDEAEGEQAPAEDSSGGGEPPPPPSDASRFDILAGTVADQTELELDAEDLAAWLHVEYGTSDLDKLADAQWAAVRARVRSKTGCKDLVRDAAKAVEQVTPEPVPAEFGGSS